jgi:D-alanyl-D-alanine carboxypeptidase
VKKWSRRLAPLLVVALLLGSLGGEAEAARKKKAAAHKVDRYASIVMDAATGRVLSESKADKRLHPASLTKMMTLYLTFEAISQGKIHKNQRLKVSSKAAMQEPSKLALQPGSTIRVEDAILALVTKSANDVAVTLAEGIAGSERSFAAVMTQRARQLGMYNTYFVNASGLHNPSQITSARDMATLSQALIRDYPREYKYFSRNNFYYAGVNHRNHNRLMSSYVGMDGIKTGYIYASGYNLAASATRNGTRLIGVVFGGRTAQSRNSHMAELLDRGFEKAKNGGAPRLAQAEPAPNRFGNTFSENDSRPTPAKKTVSSNTGAVADFDALGLITEQGDAGDEIQKTADTGQKMAAVTLPPKLQRYTKDLQPRAATIHYPAGANKAVEEKMASAATANPGDWAIQVGAFSSHEASMTALRTVRGKLPKNMTTSTQYLVAPLMTNRGMVYRARLAGLDRGQATQACRLLQGNCLILAVR